MAHTEPLDARAGFGAGVTEALVIVTPFEVVKIKLQQQKGLAVENLKYKGTLHCGTTILKEQGPIGLWAGATPTVCRNGTNQMCLFAMKANCDKWMWGKNEGDGMQLLWWQVRAASIPHSRSSTASRCPSPQSTVAQQAASAPARCHTPQLSMSSTVHFGSGLAPPHRLCAPLAL